MTTPAAALDTYCTTLLRQTELLSAHTRGANPALPVPTCPGWTLADLLRHVEATYSWAERLVRTRATSPEHLGDTHAQDAPVNAAHLAATLREAGPHVELWSPAPPHTPLFWARRMAVEATVHRYDATRALGIPYELDPRTALIGLDEWTEMSALPQAFPSEQARRELLGPDRTVHLHTTDAPGEWLIDLTGDNGQDIAVRHQHRSAAVAVRAPAADLLLLMYGRRTLDDDGIESFGDTALFTDWLRKCGDWSRRE
ncbi:maleylpyruvate isomerase family mycothiol-dependent enzyme [Streptomyces cavernicola]|uniref:Maleylpyruvate isomerase family mycothiol-dependent enzyme n=1 Tax=Streptomyces cavernicola TaxID=3043613 RepID=A0ABT6SKD5_9ACTN|nr:maleylpyruvate isomerase family mycothiol-dependent enzyme [Streptomyces sp. B-S-A6]MDI3408651.1 maleylpyruvate isomerase family mycothiol-dependent enzyme [Streptomyces sp. B-S-A6]